MWIWPQVSRVPSQGGQEDRWAPVGEQHLFLIQDPAGKSDPVPIDQGAASSRPGKPSVRSNARLAAWELVWYDGHSPDICSPSLLRYVKHPGPLSLTSRWDPPVPDAGQCSSHRAGPGLELDSGA